MYGVTLIQLHKGSVEEAITTSKGRDIVEASTWLASSLLGRCNLLPLMTMISTSIIPTRGPTSVDNDYRQL